MKATIGSRGRVGYLRRRFTLVPPYLQQNPGEKFVGHAGRTKGGRGGALMPGTWILATRGHRIELGPLNAHQAVHRGALGFWAAMGPAWRGSVL